MPAFIWRHIRIHTATAAVAVAEYECTHKLLTLTLARVRAVSSFAFNKRGNLPFFFLFLPQLRPLDLLLAKIINECVSKCVSVCVSECVRACVNKCIYV